jgi:hypothetical protein
VGPIERSHPGPSRGVQAQTFQIQADDFTVARLLSSVESLCATVPGSSPDSPSCGPLNQFAGHQLGTLGAPTLPAWPASARNGPRLPEQLRALPDACRWLRARVSLPAGKASLVVRNYIKTAGFCAAPSIATGFSASVRTVAGIHPCQEQSQASQPLSLQGIVNAQAMLVGDPCDAPHEADRG